MKALVLGPNALSLQAILLLLDSRTVSRTTGGLLTEPPSTAGEATAAALRI